MSSWPERKFTLENLNVTATCSNWACQSPKDKDCSGGHWLYDNLCSIFPCKNRLQEDRNKTNQVYILHHISCHSSSPLLSMCVLHHLFINIIIMLTDALTCNKPLFDIIGSSSSISRIILELLARPKLLGAEHTLAFFAGLSTGLLERSLIN